MCLKDEEDTMQVILNQIQLVQRVDSHAQSILARDGDGTALIMSLHDVMGDIKNIMDSNTQDAMDLLCQQYDGFSSYMKLLESMATGIASGKIQDLWR